MNPLTTEQQEVLMGAAFEQARIAETTGEVPIGAIIELDGEIIGRGHNLRETSQDATDHAEILAIKQACQAVGSWRLERARLFVTLEPCPMCAGAIINSRIAEVYFGAADPKAGAVGSLLNLLTDTRFNHQPAVFPQVMEPQAKALLQDFFRTIRAKQKQLKKTQSNG
ncbi:tRNA adenosine(34) deaminase TadA [Lapidilactobacillus mulanensis]|uniref:tRNA-specific adenosine deaminase n=1 Tax=Lapidilactobacillus mulanensis TaxID=2485999 RepID=A0ABW4DP59_9LACO|nr:tRNA adenosine(34) deaminase TadA [Lapidilactobacillus mulanensis]